MNIVSPVGEFPFEVETVRWHDGQIVVKGRMGTWPTTIEASPADLVRTGAQLMGKSRAAQATLAAGAAGVLVALLRKRNG